MISPWQKEWNRLIKKEQAYLKRGAEKKSSALNNMLAEKIPKKLQATLDTAFAKAFMFIFENGTGIIEKTYKRSDTENQFKLNTYAVELKEDRKTLRQFSKQANTTGRKNLLLSGLEGVGLGVLGIGLPDIPLFTGMLLKSVYETALHYGYPYDSDEEKYFILKLIQTSLSYGEALVMADKNINTFIENTHLPSGYSQDTQIENTASVLSTELLYMKFLQGIPLLGLIGGVYNPVYLQKIQKYVKLKYLRRFLYDHKLKTKTP